MKVGDFSVRSLSDGRFALDGGAMFGVVPKVFWQKTNPPDERNRITLALRPLLIRTPEAVVLVDTGIGTKQDAKFRDIYRVEQPPLLIETLRSAGFAPEDVTHVVNTHLHFDHAGGDTMRNSGGEIIPVFPNARYYVQAQEWEIALKPDVRSRASYLPENYQAIRDHGQLELLSGSGELVPGVQVLHTGGHTAGHQAVLVVSRGEKLIYWGDLIPTASHINVPYVMGYDTMPLITIEQKERLLRQAREERWIMCFEHDPEIAFATLGLKNDRYVVEPLARIEGIVEK